METMLKKGQRVRVWSLQSFSQGGFLNGEPGFIRQDQYCGSVFVTLIRNFEGVDTIDECYEVYPQQIKKVKKKKWKATNELKQKRNEILGPRVTKL